VTLSNDAGPISNLQRDIDAKMKETEWLREIMAYADRRGWDFDHVFEQRHYARRTGKGWPDLTLVRERVVWIEAKSEKGELRREQREIIAKLKAAGQEVYVYRPHDRDDMERTLS
jgi:predicted lipoprotein